MKRGLKGKPFSCLDYRSDEVEESSPIKRGLKEKDERDSAGVTVRV